MQLKLRRSAIAILLLLNGFLLMRLTVVASSTEVGFGSLQRAWWNGSIGLIAGDNEPTAALAPEEQARLYIEEIERVLAKYPDDAEMLMGAAILLDSPGPGFIKHYVHSVPNSTLPIPLTDDAGIGKAVKKFELICRQRSVELAKRATQLSPENKTLWRLRAVLVYQDTFVGSVANEVRTPEWSAILAEASLHDPDNALYDYIGVSLQWQDCYEFEESESELKLIVKDESLYSDCKSRFDQGIVKPNYLLGDEGIKLVTDLLSRTSIPPADWPEIARSRLIRVRGQSVLLAAIRLQDFRADQAVLEGDPLKAIACLRQCKRLMKQIECDPEYHGYAQLSRFHLAPVHSKIIEVMEANPTVFSAADVESENSEYASALLHSGVITQAETLMTKDPRWQAVPPVAGFVATIYYLVGIAPSMIVLLGLASVILWEIGRRFGKSRISNYQHMAFVTLLAVEGGLMLLLLGLFPAGIVSQESQAWVLTGLLLSTALLIIPGTIIGIVIAHRGHSFQFGISQLMLLVTVAAFVCWLLSIAGKGRNIFASFPFDLSIPPRGVDGISAQHLQNAILPKSVTYWVLAQWHVYHGLVWVAVVGIVTGIALVCLRRKNIDVAIESEEASQSNLIGDCGGMFRRPVYALLIVVITSYLWLAPTIIRVDEAVFQKMISVVKDPSEYWKSFNEYVQQVQVDQLAMDRVNSPDGDHSSAEIEGKQSE